MSVLTIARPFGAGGKTVGKIVAKKLGYKLVEEEMVIAVAKKARVSPDWVRSVEKERGNFLLNFIEGIVSPSFIEKLQNDKHRGYIDEDIYADLLAEVMEEFARENNVVILGRGGQYFLKDFKGVCHVLLTDNFDSRVKFIEKHYNMSFSRARQVVSRGDKRRANFYKKLKHKHYDDPSLYDIVINMGRVDIDAACGLITDLLAKQTG